MTEPSPSSNSRTVVVLIALVAVVAVGGVRGGVQILRDPSGMLIGFAPEMIARLPVTDYLLPGLFLLFAYGGGGGLTVWALWKRRPWAPLAAAGVGLVLLIWMLAQIALIGLRMPGLQLLMLAAGFSILSLALRLRMRRGMTRVPK